MEQRKLTGKWYLRKSRLFGFEVIVQVSRTTTSPYDFSTSPDRTCWEKARDYDFVELGIVVA